MTRCYSSILLVILSVLPCRGEEWRLLAGKLEQVPEGKLSKFGLHDNEGRSMDCLEVFQPGGKGDIYGVYHTLREQVFSVHLARSKDLKTWTYLATLDSHASQAAIHETDKGAFLLALEKDAPNSCWIRLVHYQDLAHLIAGRSGRQIDLPRTLAPTAEGTPSFESVEIPDGDLSKSTIKLHHYYENARVDQLAAGTLTGFETWKSAPSPRLNQAFKKLGALGNLGDRDGFEWQGKRYFVQEAQGKGGNWGTWGIYLCDHLGRPLKKLAFQTPRGATAFANPSVGRVRLPGASKDVMVLIAFIHSRGTHPSEVGQFLMVLP
jgi:hypothetical protein